MAAPILTLDFKRDAFLRRSLGAWLLLGGACAGVAVVLAFAAANQALLQVKRQTTELRQESAPRTEQKSTMDGTQLAAEITHANTIIRQLNLPWDKLFMALESTANDRVALLAIQPDTRKQLIHTQWRGQEPGSRTGLPCPIAEPGNAGTNRSDRP